MLNFNFFLERWKYNMRKKEKDKKWGKIYIYIKELEAWSKSSTQPVYVSEREPAENARIETIIEIIEENLPKLRYHESSDWRRILKDWQGNIRSTKEKRRSEEHWKREEISQPQRNKNQTSNRLSATIRHQKTLKKFLRYIKTTGYPYRWKRRNLSPASNHTCKLEWILD